MSLTVPAQPSAPDKATLVNESYANDEPLAVRIETHRRFTVPPFDLPTWVLQQHSWRGDETVLDIGTGTGQYLASLRQRLPQGRIIASDLAPGMLHDLAAKGSASAARAMLLNADAEALPLATASCDAITASYVIFFLPDIPRAIDEMHRVLRPGGALLAVTMASVYMSEFHAAVGAALARLGVDGPPPGVELAQRFNLENGPAMLGARFARVSVCAHESALVFHEPEPVVRYVNSMRGGLLGKRLPAGKSWGQFLEAMREIVESALAGGEFRVSVRAGVIVAIKDK